jgi:hypothetical protein
MKRILSAVAVTIVLAHSAFAGNPGSAFGYLSTARAIGMGQGYLGFGVGIADATSFTGTLKYGLANYLDGRAKLGIIDGGGETELTFGADVMYQLPDAGKASAPFDLSIGGMIEYVDFGGSILQLGGAVAGSRDFVMNNGQIIAPYGRFNVRLVSVSFNGGGDDSDLEVGLNGGVKWGITKTLNTYAEFQFDGNDGLFLGIEFAAF